MTNRSKVNLALSLLAALGLGMTAGMAGAPAEDGAARLGDARSHLGAQPLAHEVGGSADDKGAVLRAQAHRILEPGVEVRAGNLKLQLAEGSVPYTVGGGVLHE